MHWIIFDIFIDLSDVIMLPDLFILFFIVLIICLYYDAIML